MPKLETWKILTTKETERGVKKRKRLYAASKVWIENSKIVEGNVDEL